LKKATDPLTEEATEVLNDNLDLAKERYKRYDGGRKRFAAQ
jgi:hypothetical protein